MLRHLSSAAAIVVCGLGSQSLAQDLRASSQRTQLLWKGTGFRVSDRFGHSLAFIGDADRDGFEDWIAGYDEAGPLGHSWGGALLYSGRNSEWIYHFRAAARYDRLGTAVSRAGDADGDGHADFCVSAPWADAVYVDDGIVYLYAGADGGLIRTLTGVGAWYGDEFGFDVADVGDLDGDGRDDVGVGAHRHNYPDVYAGRVDLFSGADGAALRSHYGEFYFNHFGFSLAGVGDADQDGVSDVAIGTPGYASGAGRVYFYSGATGTLLWTAKGEENSDHLGWSMARIGDLDGDGRADVLTGAERAGSLVEGKAYVLSGLDGSVIRDFKGHTIFGMFGTSLAGASDIDHDGWPDLVVGAWGEAVDGYTVPGFVHVYSGGSGKELFFLVGERPIGTGAFGYAVDAGRDVNQDGHPDFLVSDQLFDVSKGRVYLYSPVRVPQEPFER